MATYIHLDLIVCGYVGNTEGVEEKGEEDREKERKRAKDKGLRKKKTDQVGGETPYIWDFRENYFW